MIISNVTGIGDPFVLNLNGAYYMYATSSAEGFRCWSSKDLIRWEDLGLCYSRPAWGADRFWAPEVYLRDGVFIMLYSAGWKKNGSLRIGIAVSDSPSGPFRDLKDEPLFDCGCAAIDATLLSEGGRSYLYFVKDCSENRVGGVLTSVICGAELDPSLSGLASDPVELCRPDLPWEFRETDRQRWNEGPAVIARNGRYYMTYSANCYADRRYCIGCAEATEPLGPFVKYADGPVLQAAGRNFSGPGHNSFFEDGDGRLMTAFHIHARPDRPGGDRRACFAPVRFDGGGRLCIDPPDVAAWDRASAALAGKRILFLGSSVTYGSANRGVSFADLLAGLCGCESLKFAVNGTTLVDSGPSSYVSRLVRDTAGVTDVDQVVVQLSTNDARKENPLGTAADAEVPAGAGDGPAGGFDTGTVAGAIGFIISYARERWNCPVSFYTGTRYANAHYGRMVALLREIAELRGIGVLDLWNDPDMNAVSPEDYARFMRDPVHPTGAGYLEWWLPKFEAFLAEQVGG